MKKFNLKLSLSIMLAFLCFEFWQIAWAGFDESEEAYKRRDYVTAFRGFNVLAEQGNVRAQCALGIMYQYGYGVDKDSQQAVFWYGKAAESGHKFAQLTLGLHYAKGDGVLKDYHLAVMWLSKAAEQNYAHAQYALGVAFQFGQGVTQDLQKAIAWYVKAAEQGHIEAQNKLAFIYIKGLGVAKDEQQSLFWFLKAADLGDADAQLNLGIMYANGRGVTKDDQQSFTWYRKAAEQGEAQAQYNLGLKYVKGLGVTKDEQQAYFWWLLAGAKGIENAKQNISVVEQVLTPQQRAQAQSDARNWRPKTADHVAKIGLPEGDENNSDSNSTKPKTKIEKSSGTGFVVSPNHIVTNVHVVEGCDVLKVNGELANILVMDTTNDLAMLNVRLNSGVATLRASNVRQGDEINAVGYPLYGLLASGAQITSGNVSALAGMQNDSRFIQISAPVQPGNSGGPLVDVSGNVVGVIVSKLNAISIAKINGDIPQNINFAISPLVLKGFLEANGINYKAALSNKRLSVTEVMSIAKRYTVLVECSR